MEFNTLPCNSELPGYLAQPTVAAATASGPQMQMTEVTWNPRESPFVHGKVKIKPISDIDATHLVVYLSGVEEVIEKKSVCLESTVKQRQFRCGQTIIPLSRVLQKGLYYEFDFSFRPQVNEHSEKCRCDGRESGLIHTKAPPSVGSLSSVTESPHGVSVRYFVYALVSNTNLMACKYLFFLPGESQFDLSSYRDNVSTLDREFETGTSLKSGLFKKTYCGTLALRSNPIWHSSCQPDGTTEASGQFEFSVVHYAVTGASKPVNLQGSYVINRVIIAAPNGMSDLLEAKDRSVLRFKVAAGALDFSNAVWKDNVLKVTAEYKAEKVLLQTPTYASCLSYGGYEMVITVKHPQGRLKLSVPFVVQATSPPLYTQLCP